MKVALALGSGGARGYAHIGVIAELKARGHEIVAISGSSMGSVVGGLEAAGRLDAYVEWVSTLTQRDVWRLLDPAITGPGAFWGRRVMDRVADLLPGARIEDLPIPFTAVATDLRASREVWFQHGALATAMRASIGIPSIFTPIVVHGRLLADGGLLNPVPMEPLLGAVADVTVAVSLSGKHEEHLSQQPVSESADTVGLLGDLTGRLRRGVVAGVAAGTGQVRGVVERWSARFAAADDHDDSEPLEYAEIPRGLRTTDVLSLSLETTQALITRLRMASTPPDLYLEFSRDLAEVFDFHRATELIDIGRSTAAQALDTRGW
ncbi:MAG: patatin-like phospholipase family protein [Propioniciclava sp.]